MVRQKKAEIWVSAIIYVLIITAAIVLIMKVGVPVMEGLKDRASFSKAKETLLVIDKNINEVASEGEGSQRIIPIDIKDGKITIANDEISWELKTNTQVIDERSSINFGNMIISSNANVRTWENEDHYIMQTTIEGDVFNVSIKKIGSPSNFSSINTSGIIDAIYYDGEKLNGTFTFLVNGDPDSANGTGYTLMVPQGNNTNIGRAKVVAHIQSSSYEYDLEIGLESFADFLTIELSNVK